MSSTTTPMHVGCVTRHSSTPVRGAYVGPWDVLDSLWWQSHPLDPAPSGTPSPAARLRDLQRQAFSAGGNAIGDHAAAQRMRELEAEIVAERAALVAALAAAQSHSKSAATTFPGRGTPVSLAETAVDSPGRPISRARAGGPPPEPRRWMALALALPSALAIGVVAGTQLTAGNADATLQPSDTAECHSKPGATRRRAQHISPNAGPRGQCRPCRFRTPSMSPPSDHSVYMEMAPRPTAVSAFMPRKPPR